MYTVLSPTRLSFDCDQGRIIDYAARYGFGGVQALLESFEDAAVTAEWTDRVREAGLRWGPASLPTTIGPGTSETAFAETVATLARVGPGLHQAGVTTLTTWLAPAHDDLPYDDAMEFYRQRLDALSPILRDNELRLALEYVGPATWRRDLQHTFVHDLAGLTALLDRVGDRGAFGVVLDSFHWYTAGESVADIVATTNILAVDLNDAIPEIARDEQLDLQRAQPGATGVIDLTGFLTAIAETGYSGPVHSEPFSDALDQQSSSQRVVESTRALRATLAAARILGDPPRESDHAR